MKEKCLPILKNITNKGDTENQEIMMKKKCSQLFKLKKKYKNSRKDRKDFSSQSVKRRMFKNQFPLDNKSRSFKNKNNQCLNKLFNKQWFLE